MIDIHQTEEEQVEAIKRWWKENGIAVVIGIVIGVALIVGVRYWWTYQKHHAQEASQIYSQLLQAQTQGNNDQMQAPLTRLKQDYDDTPYATLGSFLVASEQIKTGGIDKAISEYRWALDHAPHEALTHLARVRLGRLLVDSQRYDEALTLLDDQDDPAFKARYEELRGDVYQAKGEIQKARTAYQTALDSATGKHQQILQMKLHSLVQTQTPTSPEQATAAD
jgi:predicted negative regulator of RcsB-dependent stress response